MQRLGAKKLLGLEHGPGGSFMIARHPDGHVVEFIDLAGRAIVLPPGNLFGIPDCRFLRFSTVSVSEWAGTVGNMTTGPMFIRVFVPTGRSYAD